MAAVSARVSVEGDMLNRLGKRMRAEANGATLRKELIADLRAAVQPGVAAVQGQLRGLPSSSVATAKPPLGTYLASRVRPQVRLSGRSTGVAIRIGQTPKLRGFNLAARRLNRKNWRHPVFGHTDRWVQQDSPIEGYFDRSLGADRAKYRAAVLAACRRMAERLTTP
jgi:hypothetical protein